MAPMSLQEHSYLPTSGSWPTTPKCTLIRWPSSLLDSWAKSLSKTPWTTPSVSAAGKCFLPLFRSKTHCHVSQNMSGTLLSRYHYLALYCSYLGNFRRESCQSRWKSRDAWDEGYCWNRQVCFIPTIQWIAVVWLLYKHSHPVPFDCKVTPRSEKAANMIRSLVAEQQQWEARGLFSSGISFSFLYTFFFYLYECIVERNMMLSIIILIANYMHLYTLSYSDIEDMWSLWFLVAFPRTFPPFWWE